MKIGILGVGTMGETFLRGFHEHEVFIYDKDQSKTQFAKQNYNVTVCKDECECAAKAQVIFLCTKPGDVMACLKPLAPVLKAPKLLISIAAGVSTSLLRKACPDFPGFVRLMPNTPSLISQGALVFFFPEAISSEEREKLMGLLKTFGWVTAVPEEALMDAVTAVSGSGPAYVYYFIQALVEAAVQQGLPLDVARKLVIQTVHGANMLVERTHLPVEQLISQVKTPKGTTEAALNVLAEKKVKETIIEAVKRATERAKEISKAVSESK